MPQTQAEWTAFAASTATKAQQLAEKVEKGERNTCLLYTSDAADEP